MENGWPLSVDASGLESGNHLAKRGKAILFWGGEGDGVAKREDGCPTYVQQRATGKRDAATGELLTATVTKSANASIEVQHLENAALRQSFVAAREREKSAKVQRTEELKREGFRKQCAAVEVSIGKLAEAMEGAGAAAMDTRA